MPKNIVSRSVVESPDLFLEFSIIDDDEGTRLEIATAEGYNATLFNKIQYFGVEGDIVALMDGIIVALQDLHNGLPSDWFED